jgi:oxygen-independent coproporphyrinogen-3 oxidase
MVEALLNEIEMRRSYLSENDLIESIYFGGGTPSLLPTVDIDRILNKIYSLFKITDDVEITLEANPDDIERTRLKEWKVSGINRFSIGVQSFFEEDLIWMNRAHNAHQSENSILMVMEVGYQNLSIDLIYGLPHLSDENWIKNIEKAIAFKIPHLSCYALTIENRTALHSFIQNKKVPDIDTDQQARHFNILMQRLQAVGYDQYEISNFSRPGFRSRHNSSYWQGKNYLGIGPSAHSFNSESRQWNIANNALYIEALQKWELNYERETLTPSQQLNEYIMTSLRTIEGTDLLWVEKNWGKPASGKLLNAAAKYLNGGKATICQNKIQLTREGKFLADGIAADLFFD